LRAGSATSVAVGRVLEALDAHPSRPLDERLDLAVILQLAEPAGPLAGDERWHARQGGSRPGRSGRRAGALP
jgi:hypothetical protein